MKQQFHIVSVITRLFPFQIPEPQNNGGVIFRPLSDPDLQVIHTPCLVLMMSFVTYIFPFSGTQLMPAYEFTALFVVQLDMSVILKKPYNGVPIFIVKRQRMRLTSGHIPTNAPSTRHSGL